MKNPNITQSAKALGMSKTTLYKHVSEGKVSCDIDEQGRKIFDPSELARAYPDKFKLENFEKVIERPEKNSSGRDETPENVQPLHEKIRLLEGQITDLKQDKEKLHNMIEKQVLLIPAPESVKKKGFFARMFG